MKWESDELEGKPENVFIGKWLPQENILSHPKLTLFMSHCGLGSVAEAKYHGVPIVGLPLGIDQSTNADSIVAQGWGEKLSVDDLNQDDLESVLQKVLQNSKYLMNDKTKYFDNHYS